MSHGGGKPRTAEAASTVPRAACVGGLHPPYEVLVSGLRSLGDRDGFHADAHGAREQVDHPFRVVREAARVEAGADRRVLRRAQLVLAEHPVDRAAVPEATGPRFRRPAGKPGFRIEEDRARCGIGFQQHLRRHPAPPRRAAASDASMRARSAALPSNGRCRWCLSLNSGFRPDTGLPCRLREVRCWPIAERPVSG